MTNKLIQKIARIIYSIIGITGVLALLFLVISFSSFFPTMGLFGSLGYILLMIGGINWGIKAIFGKDLFMN